MLNCRTLSNFCLAFDVPFAVHFCHGEHHPAGQNLYLTLCLLRLVCAFKCLRSRPSVPAHHHGPLSELGKSQAVASVSISPHVLGLRPHSVAILVHLRVPHNPARQYYTTASTQRSTTVLLR